MTYTYHLLLSIYVQSGATYFEQRVDLKYTHHHDYWLQSLKHHSSQINSGQICRKLQIGNSNASNSQHAVPEQCTQKNSPIDYDDAQSICVHAKLCSHVTYNILWRSFNWHLDESKMKFPWSCDYDGKIIRQMSLGFSTYSISFLKKSSTLQLNLPQLCFIFHKSLTQPKRWSTYF